MRRIPLSRRSHIIGFQPLATGTAEHESALERDFVILTSFRDPTAAIISQPVTLKFQDGEKIRRYTPDYLIRPGVGRSRLVEVKYREDLRLHWGRLRPAFMAARAWAQEQGALFHIVTERRIRGPLLDNAKRLLPLRHAPLDTEVAASLLTAVQKNGTLTLRAILEAVSVSRRAALSTFWVLLARQTLHVDLSSPITWDTRVSRS